MALGQPHAERSIPPSQNNIKSSALHLPALLSRNMLPSFTSFIPSSFPFIRRAFHPHIRSTNPRHLHKMSTSAIPLSPTIDVHIVPVLSDNFSYLLHDKSSNTAAVVDPAEPRKLVSLADKLVANITTALVTHHHWDHAGGNVELASIVPGVEIVGSAYETAEGVTVRLESGVERQIAGSQLRVTAMRTPCHTMGHLCFKTNTEQPAVFTGDTLFVAGCGKFFEGGAADMDASLNSTLAALSDETLVFCGHEYTLTNLLFAQSVESGNQRIKEKLAWAKEQLDAGGYTVPSTVGDEKLSNPFMRARLPEMAKELGVEGKSPVEVMKILREKKNSFRP